MLPALIASCPKCAEPVLIPVGVDVSGRARCPLCKEEYQLAEVFETLPPALELLDLPVVEEGSPIDADEVGAVDAPITEPEEAGGIPSFDFMQGTADDTEEDEGVTADDTAAEGEETDELPKLGAVEDVAPPSIPPLDFGSGDSDGDAVSMTPVSSRPRPPRKKTNATAEIIKVVLGGAGGVLIALAIMWWNPWRRVDPVNLAPMLPKALSFLAPAELRSAGEEEETSSQKKGSSEESTIVEPGSAFTDAKFAGLDADANQSGNNDRDKDGPKNGADRNEEPFSELLTRGEPKIDPPVAVARLR